MVLATERETPANKNNGWSLVGRERNSRGERSNRCSRKTSDIANGPGQNDIQSEGRNGWQCAAAARGGLKKPQTKSDKHGGAQLSWEKLKMAAHSPSYTKEPNEEMGETRLRKLRIINTADGKYVNNQPQLLQKILRRAEISQMGQTQHFLEAAQEDKLKRS